LQQLALLVEQAQAEVVCATWLAISRRLPCSSAALASASSAAAGWPGQATGEVDFIAEVGPDAGQLYRRGVAAVQQAGTGRPGPGLRAARIADIRPAAACGRHRPRQRGAGLLQAGRRCGRSVLCCSALSISRFSVLS
jgi:hypothetical protein